MKIIRRLITLVFTILFIASCCIDAFAASNDNTGKNQNTYYEFIAEAVNAGNEGYLKSNEITKDSDIHYGYRLGKFFIKGFSGKPNISDKNEPLLLKTVGDTIEFGFKLDQDIDRLNNDDKLSIVADDKGYDGNFKISKTKEGMGRGTLIVQHTNYQGIVTEPQVYPDYLVGIKKGADTKLIPCEEGDYKVALDYTIKRAGFNAPFVGEVLPKVEHYKITVRFAIRNGNCMIFPMEIGTNKELTNKSITENGFYLDLANSHYLDTIVKKEMLKGDNSGLTTDVRYNRAATDGEKFEEEGVYTISVYNEFTRESTEKKICVGKNQLLKSNVVTGIPIEEINRQLLLGAKINKDGTIEYPKVSAETINEDYSSPNVSIKQNFRQAFHSYYEYYIGLGILGVLLIIFMLSLLNKINQKNEYDALYDADNENKEAKAKSTSCKKTINVLTAIIVIIALLISLVWYGLHSEKNNNLELAKLENQTSENVTVTNEVVETAQSSVKMPETTIEESTELSNSGTLTQASESKIIKMSYFDNYDREYAVEDIQDLSDERLLRYIQDDVYQYVLENINSDEYFVDNIEAIYVSKEYLEEKAFNSQENIYFGYTLSELNELFKDKKYIFTVDENGKTIATSSEAAIPDTTYINALKNIAIGGGVILVCVTASAVTAGSLPAVSMILAVSAKTGAVVGLSTGAIGGATSGVFTGIKTGDMGEAAKAFAKSGSEGFKFGAIAGAISGGIGEAAVLHGATLNGLTMNEAAIIQREGRYPLDVIKQFSNMKQYEICKKAGLEPVMINGKTALFRPIDLNYVDEFGMTNLERMQQGLAAIDPSTGIEYELHHIGQKMDSTLAVLSKAEHMQNGNNKIWHDLTGDSEINRNIFKTIRKNFWKDVARISQ